MLVNDTKDDYNKSVFLNCPFDSDYLPLLQAMVFCVHACGFKVRFALLDQDGSANRLSRLCDLIAVCRLSIHDISRIQLNEQGLPRMNMPFELGLFLGYKNSGAKKHISKNALILDTKPYMYQQFLSDIAGHDIKSHEGNDDKLIAAIRSFLSTKSEALPGADEIKELYVRFNLELPLIAGKLRIRDHEIFSMDYFQDYVDVAIAWLSEDAEHRV